jgi:hypothetical protein
MVYMSGSKNARYSASISNRTNVCGGIKKSGIASRIGLFMQSNANLIRAQQSKPKTCVVSKTIQTQQYGYRATHGGNMG